MNRLHSPASYSDRDKHKRLASSQHLGLLLLLAILSVMLWMAVQTNRVLALTGSHDSPVLEQPTSPLPAPAVAPSVAQIYQWAAILPTYPLDEYRTTHIDPEYNWPYYRFDEVRYLKDAPQPVYRLHRVIVLENELMRLLILPDLGGRIWQVIHKPSGHTMFYQNQVVKPSPWGPANQLGWLALGGLEWNLPVVEHGYDWGTPWDVHTFMDTDGAAVAAISTPKDGRFLTATIEVRLPPQAAFFDIIPYIENISVNALDFDYWHNAMLAPGPTNHVSPDLRFLLPADQVTVHSSGDERLPVDGSVISWPRYNELDLSRLGNWDQYSGFFEYPSSRGPYAGVYDPASESGVVRIYPPDIARGSKIFGLGWSDALTSAYFTDDDSAYVELHGGLATAFAARAHLDPSESVTWRERWYLVAGIGQFAAATQFGAVSVRLVDNDVQAELDIDIYPAESLEGDLILLSPTSAELSRQPILLTAGVPASVKLDLDAIANNRPEEPIAGAVTVVIEDLAGTQALSYTLSIPTDQP